MPGSRSSRAKVRGFGCCHEASSIVSKPAVSTVMAEWALESSGAASNLFIKETWECVSHEVEVPRNYLFFLVFLFEISHGS